MEKPKHVDAAPNGQGDGYRDGKDAIGYAKPPMAKRFKPGQSGNPKGRPKGSRGFAAELTEELGETIRVSENGKVKKLSKQRAMIKSLVAKAAKGDPKAIQIVLAHEARLRGSDLLTGSDADAVDKAILDDFAQRLGKGGSGDPSQ